MTMEERKTLDGLLTLVHCACVEYEHHGAGRLATNPQLLQNAIRSYAQALIEQEAARVSAAPAVPQEPSNPTHKQMMAGYEVACRFKVYEAQAFKLAEEMWAAMSAAAPSPSLRIAGDDAAGVLGTGGAAGYSTNQHSNLNNQAHGFGVKGTPASDPFIDAAREALQCMEKWAGVINTDSYYGAMHRLRTALAGVQEVRGFSTAQVRAMAAECGISVGNRDGGPYATIQQLMAFACMAADGVETSLEPPTSPNHGRGE
jgi:hypothetical protein